MSLTFTTSAPQALLKKFDGAISQEEAKGKINTWKKMPDGSYTHTSDQWGDSAYFIPSFTREGLRFNISPPKGRGLSSYTYAFYHGHLTECFLYHFERDFLTAISTALASAGDRVNWQV
ncbi:hypothetical protein SB18R_03355 [Pseudomonas oryzihabitans]|nr:hypothetical protein SB9_12590 [Pseudomonas psychrotolerans]KTT78295.1 hypothetical protein SB18R_03355 [Pseudomonas psychrotolerans]